MTDIQTRINKINRDYVQHLKKIGGGMPSRNLGRPVGGAKQGGAWYDDLEDVAITGAHIVRPFLGLGKVKKGKKGGAKFKEDKTQNKEPVEQSTLQHLYENPRELRTGLNVLYSQPPPTQLRDQAIRKDMPIDLTEVVKPPPEMSVWDAMKKGFEMPFKVIASAFGGAKPPKRKGKRGGNFLIKGKQQSRDRLDVGHTFLNDTIMYTVKQGGDIHRGDLVAVSNGNDFTVGIYFGRGSGGTVQYYGPTVPKYCKERHEERVKKIGDAAGQFKLNHLWKSFINTPRDTRILKLNRDNITNQIDIENILESKEILRQFNIEVNF